LIRPPDKPEWDTSGLTAKRRAYLDEGLSFEEIAARVIASATVISARIERYCEPRLLGEKDGRQIVFVVRVGSKTCDLLYNAPDGMRGRYWQSPDRGSAATKHLIGGLLPKLISFADEPPAPPKKCAPMSFDDIRASLDGLSAKVWPREFDEQRNWLFEKDHLKVLRWERDHGPKGPMWRQSPISGDLDIKGAIIGTDQTEYIPDGKRDRSCQIHLFGYT
jgi:hypothetical protein